MTPKNAPISRTNDEETPLLPKPARTPLPLAQFLIVLFLQLAEPLTSNVIYPFAPQLMRDIGVTHGDETKVGYYVGLMQSIFFLAEACTVLHYSRISDRIGRRPVILFGLFGLSLSMYCFGLSKSFLGLIFSRSLNGLLNGNVGVIKSIVVELCDATNIAQAYAIMPLAWSTGGTLGPIIGGSLAHPAERFPTVFGSSDFHKTYPYFLPCAVPATFSLCAWLVVFFFLKETVAAPTPVSRFFGFREPKGNLILQNVVASEETTASTIPHQGLQDVEKPLGLRDLLTPRVIVSAGNYATLSLVDITYRAVQPVFFATPIHLGGLGLSPPTIGNILSVVGILNGLIQVLFFARIHNRWGSRNTFMIGIFSAFVVFTTFPLISYLARHFSTEDGGLGLAVWAVVGFQVILSICINFSYGAIFIFIAAASPNRSSVGAVNGLSQMVVSVMRAVGPAAAASLFSLTVKYNYLGGSLVYVVLMGLVGMAAACGLMLPSHVWKN